MCGIIAGFNTKGKKPQKANDFIINQYQEQYDRGQRGFGIIRIDKKQNIEVDRACEPTKFLLDLYLKNSPMIIAHHRTPTSTENLLDQTHPMVISDKQLKNDYLIIHNGVVSNCGELYKKHIELGFVYKTEYERQWYQGVEKKYNDSESLAIELALFIEKKVSAIGTDNNAAFIILQVNKKTQKAEKVFFGRNGEASCLNMSKSKGKLLLSSEGEGEETTAGKLFSFNVKDSKMTLKEQDIPFIKKEIPKVEDTKAKEILNLPVAAAPSNQTLLPEAKRIHRTWLETQEELIMAGDPLFTECASKGYIETRNAEFKSVIKEKSARSVYELAEDALDEELDKIQDLLIEYKNNLLLEKFENREENNYSAQIFRIIKAMKEITDIADTEYNEQKLQEEIDDYTPKEETYRKIDQMREEHEMGFSREC